VSRLLFVLVVVLTQGCTSPTAPSVYVCRTEPLLQRSPEGQVTTSPSLIYRSHEPCGRRNAAKDGGA
jgi:hypothetical protein